MGDNGLDKGLYWLTDQGELVKLGMGYEPSEREVLLENLDNPDFLKYDRFV